MRMLPLAGLLLALPVCAVFAEPGSNSVRDALPLRWATEWAGPPRFTPVGDAVRSEARDILPLDDEQKAREKTLGDMIAAFHAINEPNPHVGFPAIRDTPIVSQQGPSILASPAVSLSFLAIGVVGWIALGLSAFFVSQKRVQ